MVLVAVDAAIGQKAHQVEGGALFLGALHRPHQHLVAVNFLLLHRLGDAGELLVNHPAGADVGVAHLGVAHLPLRQTHIHAGSADIGAGVFGKDAVQVGGFGGMDGVAVVLGAVAEAIHNNKCKRFLHSIISPSGVPPVSRPTRPLWGLNLCVGR